MPLASPEDQEHARRIQRDETGRAVQGAPLRPADERPPVQAVALPAWLQGAAQQGQQARRTTAEEGRRALFEAKYGRPPRW